MDQLWRGIRWEENSDDLSTDGGCRTELIGLRARTFAGPGTLSGPDLCRALNFCRTRILIGFRLWELSTDDSFPELDYLQNLTFHELGTSAGARDLPELELYGNFTELYGNFIALDYLMNFLRITR